MSFESAPNLYKHGMRWTATSSGVIDGQTFRAGDLIFAVGDPDADYLLASQVTFIVNPGNRIPA